MSKGNLEGVKQAFAVYAEQGVDGVLELVAADATIHGRIKGSGVPIRQPLGGVFGDISGGKIGSARYFLSWREASEAARAI